MANLPHVMERSDSVQRSGFHYLMGGETKGFQLAARDVTCRLSFCANVKSVLTGQYALMDLPSDEMAKLQGQATIEGDSLTIPIFNGTNWHVSEVAVALTVVRKRGWISFPQAQSTDRTEASMLVKPTPHSSIHSNRFGRRGNLTSP